MPFQLDRWNWSPRSPLVLTTSAGVKLWFGRLEEGRRNVCLVVGDRRFLGRTGCELKRVGYWDIKKEEFVSTVSFLDRDVFLSVGEAVEFFTAEGAASGEFNFCPVCNQVRSGPRIKRAIGVMISFF